ncbi:MAG: class I SAM-dependent methyltransferase [Acidobacteriota bacterium]
MTVEVRARASAGASTDLALYQLVRRVVLTRQTGRGLLVDIGCGRGTLFHHLRDSFDHYVGADLILYDEFPRSSGSEFCRVDLESGKVDLPDAYADVVCSLETIEHVENPRALMRELVRLAKPGGCVIVTTPNQLSLLSKLCLVLKNEFAFFQERAGQYPAHLSALLEIDLVHLARENGLCEIEVVYTGYGRIPATRMHWPRWLSGEHDWSGRAFSDNVLLFGRKADSVTAQSEEKAPRQSHAPQPGKHER